MTPTREQLSAIRERILRDSLLPSPAVRVPTSREQARLDFERWLRDGNDAGNRFLRVLAEHHGAELDAVGVPL